MSTDADWEAWGRRDPYYGVITHPKFRRAAMTPEALEEFFASGRVHADFVMDMARHFIDPAFAPRRVLDFGCGVGRVAIAFAALAPEVTGLDVSPAMLEEARRNCEARGVANLRLIACDDALSGLEGDFDLVHSFIVFQHVPTDRGREIFARLLERIAPGGVGALHFSYSKSHYEATRGLPPPAPAGGDAPAPAPGPDADPEMQMNSYVMNELLFLLQRAGVHRFHAEFTDHGGELGVFLFFRKPAPGA